MSRFGAAGVSLAQVKHSEQDPEQRRGPRQTLEVLGKACRQDREPDGDDEQGKEQVNGCPLARPPPER